MNDVIGKRIVGKLNGSMVSGVIFESRMRYQEIIYYVDLDNPITTFTGERTECILRNSNVLSIGE